MSDSNGFFWSLNNKTSTIKMSEFSIEEKKLEENKREELKLLIPNYCTKTELVPTISCEQSNIYVCACTL